MNVKPDDVLKYANDKELWKIKNGIIMFGSNEDAKNEIPPGTARGLIGETLNYANELERIV